MTSPYLSKYIAHELTRRLPADKAEKLAQSLSNATVDLNPHQVEAALFAFRSPLSRGAVLADEVGLGKTIEAGLVLSQLWAERKRRILCIVPATLRKQWNRELSEKFHLESTILEAKRYRELSKQGHRNPFAIDQTIVICSYQFANAKRAEVAAVSWDVVVIDEAHRLRNVYKKDNKIARNLLQAVGTRPKALLTATPLQNSLMELYGLVSFIDPHLFGSEESFRGQYVKRGDAASAAQLRELKARVLPVIQRTLRRQVTEYVRYTKRISITQDFTPTPDEQRLYEQVSAYLQKPDLLALPSGQRQLITLVLRKILASSSFAIGATLGTMIRRLEALQQPSTESSETAVEQLVGDDVDETDELQDEWSESDESESDAPPSPDSAKQLAAALAQEVAELKSYKSLAESIQTNAKGEALLTALHSGFAKATELGAPRKALIFTESRRTQLYLLALLEANGYGGQVVLFNGSNSDAASKRIYQNWLRRHEGQECVSGSPSADMRSALVEEFAGTATVMIATESAAEGVNLQFCNLVVNYDLPWNPQRIEQRIGRCHRYGQKHDVVVINFLNRANQADQRVFELLSQKFRLFDGVFGASDEVLGALESGVDFEKRISVIYQSCRTTDEINTAFDQLRTELEGQITSALQDARSKLLEHFDDEVQRKLRLRSVETKAQLSRYSELLWMLTSVELGADAVFVSGDHSFELVRRPADVSDSAVRLGMYRLQTEAVAESEIHYRIGHPLAVSLIERAKTRSLPTSEVTFDYSHYEGKLSVVEQLQGRSGWLRLTRVSVSALEVEDHLLFCGTTDDGQTLDQETCEKLMTVAAALGAPMVETDAVEQTLRNQLEHRRQGVLSEAMLRNQRYMEAEMNKLDLWAEDLKENLERELKEMAAEMNAVKREALQAPDLASKLELQKKAREVERQRNAKRKSLFDAQDEIDARKDQLLAEVEARLLQQVEEEELFTLRWRVQ